MKKVPLILLCCLPYILLVQVVYAIVMCRGQESAKTIAFWNLVVKVAHIPFYVIAAILMYFKIKKQSSQFTY